jgi:hypothetical protein
LSTLSYLQTQSLSFPTEDRAGPRQPHSLQAKVGRQKKERVARKQNLASKESHVEVAMEQMRGWALGNPD